MYICGVMILALMAEVRFGLNEDVVIGREEGTMRGIGAVVLDDCSFHENANLSEFDRDRSISIAAQDGEVSTTSRVDCTA